MENQPPNDQRLTVADVLAGHIPEQTRGKVYVTARIEDGDHITVHLRSADPAVWLNAQYRADYGSPEDFLVSDMQAGAHDGLSLVSSGVFFWIDNKLALLRRDAKAPSLAGYWTEPAGRCDALPLKTGLRELNEELLVLSGGAKLAFVYDEALADEAVAIKKSQGGLGTPIELAQLEVPDHGDSLIRIACVYLDGRLTETILGPHFFDRRHNTLEVRISLSLSPQYEDVAFVDDEPYGCDVWLFAPSDLTGDLLTPCLAHYAKLFSCRPAMQTVPA
jgi:hypothetical protein